MEIAFVSDILTQLERQPARLLETQSLEFKGWCKNEKDLSHEIMEEAVCLSNTDGGYIIVGVDDKKTAPDAIDPCPYTYLTVDVIKKWIRDLTKPPVECRVVRAVDIFPHLRGTPQGDLFIIKVQKTIHPSGHRTSRGVSYLRVDTECRPQYFADQDDYSALPLTHFIYADLSQRSLLAAIKRREMRHVDVARAGLRPIDHLVLANLVRPQNDADTIDQADAIPTIAAFLFFGEGDKLKKTFPASETIFVLDNSTISPFTSSNWYNIQEALQNCLPLINHHLLNSGAEVPEIVVFELLLNAYLHRCYRTPGPVQIIVGNGELEIRNPGGLMGSLMPENLLYNTPQYRNFLLMDAARQFGYCEKAGAGIDKVYYLLVRDGFEFPIFESSANSFKVILRLKRDMAFAKFIQDFSGGLDLKLTDLITIKALQMRVTASMEELSKITQRPEAYMQDVLADLQRRRIVHKNRDGRFELSDEVASQIARYDSSGQLKLF